MVGIYKHIPQVGGTSEITIQTDTGTDPVGDTFTFTSAYMEIDGDSGTDTVTWAFDGGSGDTTNTVLGTTAGDSMTSAENNTFIGHDCGTAVTSGSYHTAVGYEALKAQTTSAGTGNTAMGWSALGSMTTGYANVAIGVRAGNGLTTGLNNMIMGNDAMRTCGTSVSRTVAVGPSAGSNNTGNDCVFFGNTAGKYNTANQKLIVDVADRGNESNSNNGAIIYGEMQSTETDQILATAGKFMAGGISPSGKIHAYQNVSTAAIPALYLEQDDINEAFIEFEGTSAADGSRSISTDTTEDSAKYGAIRVTINGVGDKWIRLYDDHS